MVAPARDGGANLVAGSMHVLDEDGGWCWFQDERAIVHGGRVLVGTVSTGWDDPARRGDINVIAYDPREREGTLTVLHEGLECDDHDSPALLTLADGWVLAVYSRHGTDGLMRVRMGVPGAGDGSIDWRAESAIEVSDRRGATYSNTFRIRETGEEGPTVVNLFRGAEWNPAMVVSEDGGRSWQAPVRVLRGAGRPYMVYAMDGQGAIHFACSEQHPRNFDTGIRHGFFRDGGVHASDGVLISALSEGAAPVEGLTVVRAGAAEAVAWCSDIRVDREGMPVIVYSVQMDSAGLPPGRGGEDCRYRYARWDGEAWVDAPLAYAGRRLYAGEDDYTGLVSLDPLDPSIVYFSTDADPVTGEALVSGADGRRHYELFRGRTETGGRTWVFERVTSDSTVDNIRPVVAAGEDGRGMVLWLRGSYRSYTDYDLAVVGIERAERLGALEGAGHPAASGYSLAEPAFDASMDAGAIARVAGRVARWQVAHESAHARTDWTQGAYYVGVMRWAEAAGDEELIGVMRERFRGMGYALGPRPFMADDHCVGYAYGRLAMIDGDLSMMGPTRARMDEVLARRQDESLEWVNGVWDREWAWCDALFMGPPTLAQLTVLTGEARYLERADALWWKTTDYLFSPEHGLYYRDSRYFDRREANGQPVFWSRGNGWVAAGLVRMLEMVPEEHASRGRYEGLLRAMAERLVRIQTGGGFWTSSLLAPPAEPQLETSGTAFFCYALAWGINHGVLEEDVYRPAVERAWGALVSAVHADGKLGWVQRVAAAPGTAGPHETEVYAVGGFLLAASEVLRMAGGGVDGR